MLRYGVAILVAAAAGGTAHAQLSPTDIVHRHMAAAAKADVDALLADYADDAVVLQSGVAAEGKPAIRAMFDKIFPARPAGSPPPAGPGMQVEKVWQEGNVGFVSWHMGAVNGTDEFLVRNGKVAVQAVFISGPPPAAPAK